ncbi:MAG: TonB-dependent receptor [Bacteroidota bacterium]|nr:TonB-dependent receptor [Bacteroidota bacterium]
MSFSQNTFTLKGKITDKNSLEAIPFVNIYDSISGTLAASDSMGFYELKVKAGTYAFEFSSVGYEVIKKEVRIEKNMALDISLNPDNRLGEVVVTSKKISKTVEMNSSGVTTLTSASVERLPAFVGEKDILKAILLTPGIQGGQEGARGIFVRGGSPDQSLLLFHNAPVYNVAHIYGFLSVFTAEALSQMEIYKTYIPVQYGGRLSSVINIEPNFGNKEHWKGEFTIGAITSKIHIEGPLKKGKTSMNFTMRECHAGLFTGPLSRKQYRAAGDDGSVKYFFYDINGAIEHKINDKHTLRWSMYAGQDFYSFKQIKTFPRETNFTEDNSGKKLKWMNITNTLEWRIKLKKVTISNFYNYSFYKIDSKQKLESTFRDYIRYINAINTIDYNTLSKISENGWQTNIAHHINAMHHLNYGVKFAARTFSINTVNITNKDSTGNIYSRDTFTNPKVIGFDLYTYLDYLFTWKNKIDIKTGVQLFMYHAKEKTFFYAEPRVEAIYHPVSNLSIRASVLNTVQPMHLLTNSTGDIQNDVWVPATSKVQPETSWQYSGGIQYDHPKGYSASIDAYYKTMRHLSEYRYKTSFILDKISWEDQLLNSGTGKAYGLEFFFAKTKGQFSAWVKYNLGWSTRQFPELNEGKEYYYKYDRRHDISIVLQYKLKKHFDFSIAWTYGTGWRMTTPNSKFASDNTITSYDAANTPLTGDQNMNTYWNAKNNYVLPAYHHLDIGMNYIKKGKHVTHQLNVSVYNVYNNFNIFTVYRQGDVDKNGNRQRKYVQLSLFPVLPSISYTIKFEK